MTLLSIPLPTSSEPHLIQTTQLEGQTYIFEFNWNSRTDRWSFNLSNSDGTAILNGALLGIGVELLRTNPSTFAHVPPGILYVAGADDPTLATIGECVLMYDES